MPKNFFLICQIGVNFAKFGHTEKGSNTMTSAIFLLCIGSNKMC